MHHTCTHVLYSLTPERKGIYAAKNVLNSWSWAAECWHNTQY
jgi:hypothetical protein